MSFEYKDLQIVCTPITNAEMMPTMSHNILYSRFAFGTTIAPYNPPGIFVPVRGDDSGGI
jgi:hypothetical protein